MAKLFYRRSICTHRQHNTVYEEDTAYYVFGPKQLMRDIEKTLHSMVIDDVRCEVFGPQLGK